MGWLKAATTPAHVKGRLAVYRYLSLNHRHLLEPVGINRIGKQYHLIGEKLFFEVAEEGLDFLLFILT